MFVELLFRRMGRFALVKLPWLKCSINCCIHSSNVPTQTIPFLSARIAPAANRVHLERASGELLAIFERYRLIQM